jgi:hypothetical protein
MNYSVSDVNQLMVQLMLPQSKKQQQQSENTINRMKKNFYGVDAIIILKLWELIKKNINFNISAHIYHLMWMFAYFKTYAEYEQYSAKFECSVPTFRTWVWYMAKQVGELPLVSTKIKLFFTYYIRYLHYTRLNLKIDC